MYDSLGFAARIVLHPSPPIRASMTSTLLSLSSSNCSNTVGIHLRGGHIDGDFDLHENRTPLALARVVQAVRQAAEQQLEEQQARDQREEDGGSGGARAENASAGACVIIAGDHPAARDAVRASLQSWGFVVFDISGSALELANVGVSSSVEAARASLTEWFILSVCGSVVVQQHSSFGLSAGIYGGSRGFTVGEHRVINGWSCHPWNGASVCLRARLREN